jgi:hypothetical protein
MGSIFNPYPYSPSWVKGYVVRLTQGTNGDSQFRGYSIKLAQKVNKMLGGGFEDQELHLLLFSPGTSKLFKISDRNIQQEGVLRILLYPLIDDLSNSIL